MRSDAHTAAIGLGSNLGVSLSLLQQAWCDLVSLEGVAPLSLSSPYQSQPLDMDSDHWFVNAVGVVRTSLEPLSLLDQLLAIEARYGRTRVPGLRGYQDRTLDLDLLLFDDLVLGHQRLTVPHPRLHRRLFVLVPLAEIASFWCHPVLLQTMDKLQMALQNCESGQFVKKMAWNRRDAT